MGPVSEKGVATPPPQTMSIEAGAGMKGESEKEWYYMTRERERVGLKKREKARVKRQATDRKSPLP